MKTRLIIVSAVCITSLVLMTTIFLCGDLGQGIYIGSFFTLLFFGLVACEFPRIREFSLNWFKVHAVLADAKEIRDDVYAEAETVKQIAGSVADIALIIATDQLQLMQWFNVDRIIKREEERIHVRDRVLACLKSAGRTQDEIETAKEAFNSLTRQKLFALCVPSIHQRIDQHLRDLEVEARKPITELSQKQDADSQVELKKEQEAFNAQCAEWKRLREYASSNRVREIVAQTNCDTKELEKFLDKEHLWIPDVKVIVESLAKFRDKCGINYTEA